MANTHARARPFSQVDAFSPGHSSLLGNPAAVVIDGSGLSQEQRQQFSNWTNLSETTFLVPPTDPSKADYKVHIHTTDRELPFAGHPTLCSARAWLEHTKPTKLVSGDPTIVTQECGIGLVKIRLDPSEDGGRLSLAAPDFIKFEPATEEEIREISRALNIDRSVVLRGQWTDNGPGWCTLLLKSAQDVLAAELVGSTKHNVGLVGPYEPGVAALQKAGLLSESSTAEPEADTKELGLQPAHFEVRGLFDRCKLEDPVTGSLNAGIARWLIEAGWAPASYVSSQGTKIGRRGRVHVQQEEGTIWVGGRTACVINGQVTL
ncbi:unnamed protein product [Jaminaea pallidilutea]